MGPYRYIIMNVHPSFTNRVAFPDKAHFLVTKAYILKTKL